MQPWAPHIHGDDKKVPVRLGIKPSKLWLAVIDPIKLCLGMLSVLFWISRELYFSPSEDLMRVDYTNKSNDAFSNFKYKLRTAQLDQNKACFQNRTQNTS